MNLETCMSHIQHHILPNGIVLNEALIVKRFGIAELKVKAIITLEIRMVATSVLVLGTQSLVP